MTRMNNIVIIILLLMCSALCFGMASNCSRLENLERELNALRRSHYYNQTVDALYWKPKIWEGLPADKDPNRYHEAITEAGSEWFPDDWQDRPLK